MTLPAHLYADPAKVCENKQYFSLGCGACACHQPKPDMTEYRCIAGCKQWPNGSDKSCGFFKKRTKVFGPGR